MEIKSVMTRPVVAVSRKIAVIDAVKKMAQKGIGCVVVVEKKIPIGIFTKFDLLNALDAGLDLAATPLEKVMHTPVMPIDENDPLFNAARQMDKLAVHRFIVVDAGNRLRGIVTSNDIVRAFAARAFPFNQSLATIAGKGLTATPKTPIGKIVRMMVEARAAFVTVLKGGKPAGIVTDALIVRLAAKTSHPLNGSAEGKMIKKFVAAPMDASVREVIVRLVKTAGREIVVTDGHGRYYGAVSQLDMVNFIEAGHL